MDSEWSLYIAIPTVSSYHRVLWLSNKFKTKTICQISGFVPVTIQSVQVCDIKIGRLLV